MKFSKILVPRWAYVAFAAMPLPLLSALLWWAANQKIQTASLIQLLAHLSSTGVLAQPGVTDYARGALNSGSSGLVLLSAVAVVVALSLSMLLITQPQTQNNIKPV